ncbi:hypothetical protein Maes01_02222 [Microbulbifer aestuariivivens]|uniref:Type I secretion protein TolC n=1 Tax=Microbulbifer aestuariivivens TaxID=1908308 RepID=A0ABP9WR29_9GAMM
MRERQWKVTLIFMCQCWMLLAPVQPQAEDVREGNPVWEATTLLIAGQYSGEPAGRGAQQTTGVYQSKYAAPTLTMTESVQQAVSWHPRISESVNELFQSQQNIRIARSGYFPQLSAGVLAGHDSQVEGDGDGHAFQLSASQVIYDFGKISSGVDLANAEATRSLANVLLSVDEIARQTASAAIEVQRYQALLLIAQERIDGVQSIASLVKMRSDSGASSRSDFLQATSRIQAASAEFQQTEARLQRWRAELQSLTGTEQQLVLSMDSPSSLESACEKPVAEIAASPRVLIADASREEAMARLKESRANAWPTLSLEASYNRYLDPRYVDVAVIDENEAAVFLNLSMPIYQGGRISASKESNTFALQAADYAMDTAIEVAKRDYRSTQEQERGLARSLDLLEASVRSIQETRDLYRKQYSSLGTRTLLDLLNSEQEVYRARQDLHETLFNLQRLRLDCLFNVGAMRSAFGIEGQQVQGVEILP